MRMYLVIVSILVLIIISGCNDSKAKSTNLDGSDVIVSVNINTGESISENISVSLDLSSPEKMAEEYMKLYTTSMPSTNRVTINTLFYNKNINTYLDEPIRYRKIDKYELTDVNWDDSTIISAVQHTFENNGFENYGIIISFFKTDDGYKITNIIIDPSVFSDLKD